MSNCAGDGRYILRRAAGQCWLLDVGQSGDKYREPLVINETGSRIIELLAEGCSPKQVASRLAAEYDDGEEGLAVEIMSDVEQFLALLEHSGIDWRHMTLVGDAT